MKRTARAEGLGISRRLMAQLTSFPISGSGQAGADLRWSIGRFIANFSNLIDDKKIGTQLLACFEDARLAGATMVSMGNVRKAMLAEAPMFMLGLNIINAAVLFSFVEQSKILTEMVFRSRSEVDVAIDRMTEVIEEIKLHKADFLVVSDYRNFIALSALLIQHLASTQRLLPRIVDYRFPINYPTLAMANRIYADGSRAEELALENHTIHPAFMQRHILALSE